VWHMGCRQFVAVRVPRNPGKIDAMSLVKILLGQCSKPRGWHGRITLRNMNRGHAELTAWGLKHVAVQRRDTILDVGCGGGVTVARLAAMAPEGKTCGIDYSAESVAASRKENRERVAIGQVEIVLGSVSHLPFPDRMFDLVTAVETHYFWPDLIADTREILRVLKPGGTFVLIAEAYKGGKYDERLKKLDKVRAEMRFALLSIAEFRDLFSNSGYSDIQITEEYERGWVYASGRKHD
jgi:ubiquinone/menaquinone biosynthesis C-methylase UbiE